MPQLTEEQEALLFDFVSVLLSDLEDGRVRELSDYQKRFTEIQDAVADEYHRRVSTDGDATREVRDAGPRKDVDEHPTLPREAPVESPLGGRVGPYRLIRELGRGGQGAVFLARDTRIERDVAIKVLAGMPGFLSASQLARFRREATIIAHLDHPGICRIFDAAVDDGIPYIAMRHVEGTTLSRVIAAARSAAAAHSPSERTTDVNVRARLAEPIGDRTVPCGPRDRAEVDQLLAVVERIALALHAAHEAGVIHRDVKPDNIMIAPDGAPVVLDFGLARDEGDATLTGTDEHMGTPAYMSPEQMNRRERTLDRRTDVYSLGVTLFECLVLERPHTATTRAELFDAVLRQDAPDVRTFNADLPRDLAVVLEVAMERDRDRRYQTAFDLAEDLARVRRREPIRARPVPWTRRLMRWAERHPAVAIGAPLLFLAVTTFSVVTGVLWRKERNTSRDLAHRNEEVLGLADVQRLEEARREAEALFPAGPELVPRLHDWLHRYRPLAARVERHERSLAGLRARAVRSSSERDRARDHPELAARREAIARRVDEVASDLARATQALRTVEERLAAADGDDDDLEAVLTTAEDREDDTRTLHEALVVELSDVERELADAFPRSFELPTVEEQWRHDVLTELVIGLRRFAASDDGLLARVAARLTFAETIAKRSVTSEAARWEQAREEVAGEVRYRGLELSSIIGLVPLGADPVSGLQEFLHLATHAGPIPERDVRGRLREREETGIVLALVPGGRFFMGAQRQAPDQRRHVPWAALHEGPVRELEVAPFLLAKHEMTQDQWTRFVGANPSYYAAGPTSRTIGGTRVTGRHPVESVAFIDAERVTARMDLRLPTETEWEYAARAGTDTLWHTGDGVASLAGHANLGDEGSLAFYDPVDGLEMLQRGFADGFDAHAPVGSFLANGFGLTDVHGNVGEWCANPFYLYGETFEDDTTEGPLRLVATTTRMARGGSFRRAAAHATCHRRLRLPPDQASATVGLRPARALSP